MITWLIRRSDGEVTLSVQGASLIFGVPSEHLDGRTDMPEEWIRRGRRRAREAAAHGDDDTVVCVLDYWARKELTDAGVLDLGAEVVLIETNPSCYPPGSN